MGFKKTGYSAETAKRYVIDAAVVYTNVTYTTPGGFTGTLHGATSGGVVFTIENNYRDVEIDGTSHMKVKGNKILESANGMITTKMKEITAKLIQQSLNGTLEAATEAEAPTGYQIIKSKRKVEEADYLTNIAVVGTLSGTSDPIIVIMDNPLCINGLEGSMEDNNEMVIEQEFEAHATLEQLEADEYPWRILFPSIA